MPGDDFWLNLRTAVQFLVPTVSAESASQDVPDLEQKLQSTAGWLTPGSVDDFDPQDFAFLAPADLDRLQRSVEAFRQVASQVPGDRPASPQQLESAATPFGEIVRLLRPHLFPNLETFKIQYRLENELRGKLPRWVEDFVCETGVDLTDDPALWVWVYVSQEAVDNDLVVKEGQKVREVVLSAVRRLRIDRWPYVRFQSRAELALARKGGCR
jgi:hypothetical protein